MDDRCGSDNRPLYAPAATDVIDALLGEVDPAALRSSANADPDDSTERRPPASVS